MPNFISINGWACEDSVLEKINEAFKTVYVRQNYFSHTPQDSLKDSIAPIDDITVIGYSLGGLKALKLANNPKVKAIVLISSFADFCTGLSNDKRLKKLRTLQLNTMIRQCEDSVEELVKTFRNTVFTPQQASELKESFYNTEQLKLGLEELKESVSVDTITKPVLILHGKEDQIVPYDFAERLHKSLENSELASFETCGHALPMLHSEQIIDRIKSFIEQHKL